MEKAETRQNAKTALKTTLTHLPLLARLVVGAVFLAACADKILNPAAFADMVANYDLLPLAAVNIFALILPWVELLTGLLLITGFWPRGATLLANALMLLFIGAVAINMIRGVDVHCGCFTTHPTGSPDMLATLLRDFLLMIPCGYLAMKYLFRRE